MTTAGRASSELSTVSQQYLTIAAGGAPSKLLIGSDGEGRLAIRGHLEVVEGWVTTTLKT